MLSDNSERSLHYWPERDEVLLEALSSRTGVNDLVEWGLDQNPVVRWPSCTISLWGIVTYALYLSPSSSETTRHKCLKYLKVNCFTIQDYNHILGPKGIVPLPEGLKL